MEPILLMIASTIIYYLAAAGFAYRGQWHFAGVQFFYACANVCLILAAMADREK